MKIVVYNQQQDVPLRKPSVRPIVQDVLVHEGITTDELTIYFVSIKEICHLHQEFFNDPTPTDCISFPVDAKEDRFFGYHILGEIFICPKKALEYDRASVYQEITLYLVHGILHLIGYDDIELKERRKMRAAEKRHMQRLITQNLLIMY